MASLCQISSDEAGEHCVRLPAAVDQTIDLVQSDDPDSKIHAAKEIRRLTKTSSKHRRHFSGAIGSLVSMLQSDGLDCKESAILALLNLSVKDERNKIEIIDAGALEPLISFLRLPNSNLREYATAALLTLSASVINKPTISTSGAIPLLVEVLKDGNPQSKVDALMALYNLSTLYNNLTTILTAGAVSPLINLLKRCKKSSKTAEKCSALLESLLGFDEGRTALMAEEGGVLTVVEVLEDGSLQSREHAVGALLTMCESDRCRYREAILKEGAIPGLLELTVQGTRKSQSKAHALLQLLRDSPCPRSELEADTLENIVSNIVLQIDGEDRCGKAKKMLAEMVQVSMERSLSHLQQRAMVCTTTDVPHAKCPTEVPSK
ncbi:U-box domain-containing protein 2-like [Magnolia sinica]|uniref:U-box domain-containing protein 2-like n=1 Tax=Magnolia sinica TaxID=86752 RepID=UPI0026583E2E|nr:U-box domain-containing protein 2-like [Magnolia sinica]